jgi:hypothetical protein
MKFIDKVKALFAEEVKPVVDKIFVKTKDGKILSIAGTELVKDAGTELVNEDATETPVEDGEYILEDESTITVKDGKVSVITPKVVEVEVEYEPATEEVVMAEVVAEEVVAEEVTVNEIDELKALVAALQEELDLLKKSLEDKNTEIEMTKEAFNKLKSEPATESVDVRKFEKTETANKKDSMLSAVKNIINKK